MIQIAGHRESGLLCPPHRIQSDISRGGADRGCDLRNMKPSHVLIKRFLREISRLGQCHGAVFAIVQDAWGPLVSTGLEIVEAESPWSTEDARGVDSETAEFANAHFRQWILIRQYSDVHRRNAEHGKPDGDIGFTASKTGVEPG